jgi:hypothetical protein
MHPMQPLRHDLGLCHVRTQVAMDEPPAWPADPLPRLTEPVLGYLEVVSRETPVIYVVIEGDDQTACGWNAGRLRLGPLRSQGGPPPRRLFRRPDAGAIDAALHWLGVPRARGSDRLEACGLAEQREWEPR